MFEDLGFYTDTFIKKLYKSIRPSLACRAKNKREFLGWQKALKAKVRELLGPLPKPAPLKPDLQGREETAKFIREKWIIQTEKDCFMPLYLLVPRGLTGKTAAVLCCHGHGPFGKDSVAGATLGQPERAADIHDYNSNYGEQMAEHGFITIVPDWRSFGERIGYSGQDMCGQHFLRHLLLGRTLLGSDLFDAMRAIDFLLTRKEVDRDRIGCMGLSFGGTMTTYLTLLDPRIKAGDIVCYATTTEHYAINQFQVCGSQLVPFLYRYADIGDVMAAIAPKPLLVESRINDACFFLDSARKAHEIVKRGYRAAGSQKDLWFDISPGIHGFSGAKAFDFFERYLNGTRKE